MSAIFAEARCPIGPSEEEFSRVTPITVTACGLGFDRGLYAFHTEPAEIPYFTRDCYHLPDKEALSFALVRCLPLASGGGLQFMLLRAAGAVPGECRIQADDDWFGAEGVHLRPATLEEKTELQACVQSGTATFDYRKERKWPKRW